MKTAFVVEASAHQGDPCERQHPFRVSGKDLDGRGRSSQLLLLFRHSVKSLDAQEERLATLL